MKRGASHIEIILSFVIFVTAVGFALYFFNPADTSRLVDSSLTYTFREISKNTSLNVRYITVRLNRENIENEGNPEIIAINISNFGENLEMMAEKYGSGVMISYFDKSNGIAYIKTEDNWNSVEIIILKFSEEFSDTETLFAELNESFYETSSSGFKELVSEKKMSRLSDFYENNYFALKEQFNLPDRVNMGFSLVFSDDDKILAEREKLSGLEVFSQTKRIEVLRLNGGTAFADLNVKLW